MLESLFYKRRLQHKCFLVKFVKFLRTPILKNICQQLLLDESQTRKCCITSPIALTHLFSMHPFSNPGKGFLILSGGREMVIWEQKG